LGEKKHLNEGLHKVEWKRSVRRRRVLTPKGKKKVSPDEENPTFGKEDQMWRQRKTIEPSGLIRINTSHPWNPGPPLQKIQEKIS